MLLLKKGNNMKQKKLPLVEKIRKEFTAPEFRETLKALEYRAKYLYSQPQQRNYAVAIYALIDKIR